jgi:alkylhydroperoxidase/carboxymuconolactone decarboxylase family protein YurZ
MSEIFLQCGVYCGAPAALESHKVAQQVFKEDGIATDKM